MPVLPRLSENPRVDQLAHLVQEFRKIDEEFNNGRAALIWPMLLEQSYPCFVGCSLAHMICQLVLRSLYNQGSGLQLQDFIEVFCGKANLTKEMLRGGFLGTAYDYVNLPDHDVLQAEGFRLILDSLSAVRRRGPLVASHAMWFLCCTVQMPVPAGLSE